MALQPLDDRIVVKPGESEETTASGLVIPDTAKEKPQQGEVLAVGPGKRSEQSGEIIPVGVSVGDTSRMKCCWRYSTAPSGYSGGSSRLMPTSWRTTAEA